MRGGCTKLKTVLKPWQEKAYEKLRHIKIAALYLEQGLGKTRTALELIKDRINKGKVNKVLWLCPCSVKDTIREQFKIHVADGEEDIRVEGMQSLSSSIKLNFELLQMAKDFNVYLVVDESNLVKNHRAVRTENIIRLSKMCKYKLILNGTPINKNETDLFAQWYILDWRILGYQSFWSFAANHIEWDERIPGKVVNCLNTDYLVRKIAPYTYQVTKQELIDQGVLKLPEKKQEIVYYNLTKEQRWHYEEVAEELLYQIDEFDSDTIYRLFSGLQAVISGYFVTNTEKSHLQRTKFFNNSLENPRIKALLDYIGDDFKEKEKSIIFCKYTDEIKDIVAILNAKFGPDAATPFYGEIKQKERQKNLGKFENKSQFLVANKTCAGYGLNLQFCHNVIFYNNDWDYATRSQAEDRVYRIGQMENVWIIDICAAETLDERILHCLNRKENLVDSLKKEIREQKDDKFIRDFIYKKDSKGRTYKKKMRETKVHDELEEG